MKGLAAHILANIEEVENEIRKDLKYKKWLKTMAKKQPILFRVNGEIVSVYPSIVDYLRSQYPNLKEDKEQVNAFKAAIIENAIK
jgi:hypothetical protein